MHDKNTEQGDELDRSLKGLVVCVMQRKRKGTKLVDLGRGIKTHHQNPKHSKHPPTGWIKTLLHQSSHTHHFNPFSTFTGWCTLASSSFQTPFWLGRPSWDRTSSRNKLELKRAPSD